MMSNWNYLPLDCVSKIISFVSALTVLDVCRFAMVSTVFKNAVDSNLVWEKVQPIDYQYFISKSENFSVETLRQMPKKALVMHLVNTGIIIDDGRLIFKLDKYTGKNCFTIRGENFRKKDNVYLQESERIAIPRSSRFYAIARFNMLTEFRYAARMEPCYLSEQTRYGVYMIFKLARSVHTYLTILSKLRISFKAKTDLSHWIDREDTADVPYFHPRENYPFQPRDRGNGVKEHEIGDFFNIDGRGISPITALVDEYIQTNHESVSGVILIGVEIRPIIDD